MLFQLLVLVDGDNGFIRKAPSSGLDHLQAILNTNQKAARNKQSSSFSF